MQRCFVRMPDAPMRLASRPMLDAAPTRMNAYYSEHDNRLLIADLSDQQRAAAEKNGAEVFEDVLFEHFALNPFEYHPSSWAYWDVGRLAGTASANLMRLASAPAASLVPYWQTKTLRDVLDQIKAPAAWGTARGAGVTIGVIDTGVSSLMPEFPAAHRSPFSKSFSYASPWEDPEGHGSMCACIAAATDASGGRYAGVAPDSTLMSLRTTLYSTDIYKLYDWVLGLVRRQEFPGPVVLSNSYGNYVCSAPSGLPEEHPYRQIVLDTIAEGVTVVFAAGNNHYDVLCNHAPDACRPNTIWGVNSIDQVISVGTVNWNNKNTEGVHANSSRGPGQWASQLPKPDCVAPTYGEVVWGSSYRAMEWWGTSGACPQVAGLAALLLSAEPDLSPADVSKLIRESCDALDLAPSCVGSGIINCQKAVNALTTRRTRGPASKAARAGRSSRMSSSNSPLKSIPKANAAASDRKQAAIARKPRDSSSNPKKAPSTPKKKAAKKNPEKTAKAKRKTGSVRSKKAKKKK